MWQFPSVWLPASDPPRERTLPALRRIHPVVGTNLHHVAVHAVCAGRVLVDGVGQNGVLVAVIERIDPES